MTTALFLLRATQLGIHLRDMEELTIGEINDMLTETQNDNCKYDTLATQGDFDSF